MTMRVSIAQLDAPPPPSGVVQTNIVASTGGQGAATPLTARNNIIRVCPNGGGVVLQVLPDNTMKIFNRCGTGQALLAYPAPGTNIEGYGLNVPVNVADGGAATFTFDGSVTWVVS